MSIKKGDALVVWIVGSGLADSGELVNWGPCSGWGHAVILSGGTGSELAR